MIEKVPLTDEQKQALVTGAKHLDAATACPRCGYLARAGICTHCNWTWDLRGPSPLAGLLPMIEANEAAEEAAKAILEDTLDA